MAKVLTLDGRVVLELAFDEAWDLRNALCFAVSKKEEEAEYWERKAEEAGDMFQLGKQIIWKEEAENERTLAGQYEQLKAVVNEYLGALRGGGERCMKSSSIPGSGGSQSTTSTSL